MEMEFYSWMPATRMENKKKLKIRISKIKDKSTHRLKPSSATRKGLKLKGRTFLQLDTANFLA